MRRGAQRDAPRGQMLARRLRHVVTFRRPRDASAATTTWHRGAVRRPLPAVTAGFAASCGCATAAVVLAPESWTASCDAPCQEQIVGAAAATCCLAATYLLWPQHMSASEASALEEKAPFVASSTFEGPKAGYIFTTGPEGTGYYLDTRHTSSAPVGERQQQRQQAATPGYTKTDSGLQYRDIRIGEGAQVEAGNTIRVHYVGRLYSNRVLGEKFDSSYDRREPISFPIGVGAVIPGWDEGVLSMKEGGKRTLIVPPHLGYGKRGAGRVIRPNATLHFEVELIDAGNTAGMFGSFKKMLQ